MADDQNWYYKKGDEKVGPISSVALKQLASSGELLRTDFVFKTDWEDWRQADSIKGMFASESNSPKPPLSLKAVQTMQAATEAADQVTKKFWFLDLKFESFAAPRLAGFVFACSLVLLVLGFVASVLYALYNLPVLQAVLFTALSLISNIFLAVVIRVVLEISLLAFRVAEHLKYLRHLVHLDK